MRNYQTLTLVGSILGMLIAFGVYTTIGVLNVSMNVFENMTGEETQINPSAKRQIDMQYITAGVGVSIFSFIVALVLAFVIKERTKIVGISLIIIAVITFFAMGLFGVIPFALLLPAGIVAIRYKLQAKATT